MAKNIVKKTNYKTSVSTKQKVHSKTRKSSPVWEFPLNRKNIFVLAAGVAVIIIGFALMATGITNDPALPDGTWNNPFAVTIAPLLLVFGYCVVIPYGILKFFGSKNIEEQQD